MPVAIANPPRAAIAFDDFIAAIDGLPKDADGAIDPRDAAPALGGLARNRDFLAQVMISELKTHCASQLSDNRYGPQVVMLHQARGLYAVRANIWPAESDAEVRANGAHAYFYGRVHDHNFDFLTVGYCGPGYVSDYYDYGEGADNGVLSGYPGETVPLRFVERSALHEGRMLLYRAGIDIHCQWPPESLSISLNVMQMSPGIAWRNQYLIDVEDRSVIRPISFAASECLLAVAVHFDPNGCDLAHEFVASHRCERMRWSAARAIAATLPDAAARYAWFVHLGASDSALVAACAVRAANGIELETDPDASALGQAAAIPSR